METTSHLRRSLNERAKKAERYGRIAKDPSVSRFVGRVAAFAAWHERPKRFELAMARFTDRLHAWSEREDQTSQERLQAAIGRYRRMKVGEPDVVPASVDVMQAQFAEEQRPTEQQ